MIWTSYYRRANELDGLLISISVSRPKGIKVDGEWLNVAPPWPLLEKYKSDGDETYYETEYRKYLNGLNLDSDVEAIRSLDRDVYLMCYEAPGKMCHRHILADFLNKKYGMEIFEY